MAEPTYNLQDAEAVPIDEAVAQLEDGVESTSTPTQKAADAEAAPPSDPNEVSLETPAEEASEASEADDTPPDADDFAALRDMVKGLGYKDAKSFIDGLHESWRSSKEARQELADIKSMLAERETQAEPEPDPDVVFHEENINSLQGKIQSLAGQETQLLQQISKINTDLAEKRGELRNADDSERSGIEAAIARLEGRIENLSDKWSGLNDKKTSLNEDIRKEQRLLTKAEKAAEKALQNLETQRQQRQEAEEAVRTQTRQEFDTTVDELLQSTGWADNTKSRQKEAIRGMVLGHLRALGKDGPAQDIPALTRAVAEAHIESLKEITRSKFAKASVAKVKAAAPTRSANPSEPPPPPATPTRKHRRDMTQADWEELANNAAKHYSQF